MNDLEIENNSISSCSFPFKYETHFKDKTTMQDEEKNKAHTVIISIWFKKEDLYVPSCNEENLHKNAEASYDMKESGYE